MNNSLTELIYRKDTRVLGLPVDAIDQPVNMFQVILCKTGFIVIRICIVISLIEWLPLLMADQVLLAELRDDDLLGVVPNNIIQVL